ncbi:hypothetical protein QF000_000628 [Paraburkholderia atlantica]|uniref:hypothetical protein n=1 Tax=Paraburkholderia atlantica TaxID=2654982 RepID=UPI003D25AA5B
MFSISGVPWLAIGQEKILPVRALRANCLCSKHNSALSPLDDAARYFFLSLKNFLESDSGVGHALVSGHDIERWLLKTAKAMAVSGNLAKDNHKLSGAFAHDQALIGMLDDSGEWPDGAGLYCVMNAGDHMVNHSRFQLSPLVNDNEEIVGLQLSILGLIFILLLDQRNHERYEFLAGAKYRPGRISIVHPQAVHWLTMSWEDDQAHDSLTLQFVKSLPPIVG